MLILFLCLFISLPYIDIQAGERDDVMPWPGHITSLIVGQSSMFFIVDGVRAWADGMSGGRHGMKMLYGLRTMDGR